MTKKPKPRAAGNAKGFFFLCFLFLVAIFFANWYDGNLTMNPYSPEAMQSYYDSDPPPPTATAPTRELGGSTKTAGDMIRFNQVSYVAVSEEALDRSIELAIANDTVGLSQMLVAGLCIEIQPGTEARVIDPGILSYEIRIASGPHNGQAVFLPTEQVTATTRVSVP